MTTNQNLTQAKSAKNDEFYTRMCDIEEELSNYKEFFENKIIYCNCDNPTLSNFSKYFESNFESLKLKKVISTYYNPNGKSYRWDMSYDQDEELVLTCSSLAGNGDFRSQECLDILDECDIVVTNPPWSLFNSFITMMVKLNKNFILLGNSNALSCKDVFQLFKDNKVKTGFSHFNTGLYFYVPDNVVNFHKIIDGKKTVRVSSTCWFTNLPIKKTNKKINFTKKYTSSSYSKYENYNAINVDKYLDIPKNYKGAMGVPITFLDKIDMNEFKILGHTHSADTSPEVESLRIPNKPRGRGIVNGKVKYDRLLIRRVNTKKKD